MEHLALYRKYRPKDFDDVIGQSHITKTLINQIKNNNIGHAYLFCGTRGTGKTSIAKIFARAINCENFNENGKICGKCKSCETLENPANLDIMEIDAASNNGVDNIRELRDKIKYAPIGCKYKVYIIDEVHMLTDSAFNALLKTLEEPPTHAIFILATTESQKIPATIVSRCIKFDFKLVENSDLEKHLEKIFKKEKISFEPSALSLIASLGEGSVRDTLSVAEMCVAYSNGNVTYENVISAVGVTDRNLLFNMASSIINKNSNDLLTLINEAKLGGKNFTRLSKDLLNYFRDLMVAKTCNNAEIILKLPNEIFEKLKSLAPKIDNMALLNILTKLSSLEQEFRYTASPQTLFEITMLTLLEDDEISKLNKRVSDLENMFSKMVNP